MNETTAKWISRAIGLLFLAVFFLIAFVSLYGCSHCKPEVIYQPVEVKIPVPVECPDLPLPEPPDCGEPPGEWRDAASYLKQCYDRLATSIEEYVHVIESHNEGNDIPSQ